MARLGVACYDEAMTRWLARPLGTSSLGAELDGAFDEVAGIGVAEVELGR